MENLVSNMITPEEIAQLQEAVVKSRLSDDAKRRIQSILDAEPAEQIGDWPLTYLARRVAEKRDIPFKKAKDMVWARQRNKILRTSGKKLVFHIYYRNVEVVHVPEEAALALLDELDAKERQR